MNNDTPADAIRQADIEIADAVAEAIASVQIAYSHDTNLEFRTVNRKWSVHDACEGNPFDRDQWLAVFTDKEEANEFARNLKRERASQAVARHRSTSLAAQDGLVEALRKALNLAVMTLAFIGRDQGTTRIEATLDGLCELAKEADPIIRAALASIEVKS